MATEELSPPRDVPEPAPSSSSTGDVRNRHGAGRHHAVAPDSRYRAALADVTFRPVFIMGGHRSGTTLLYHLLAQTGHFCVVTSYHIINYNSIIFNYFEGIEDRAKQLLRGRFAGLGLTSRLIDDVAVTPDTPEEYGFILSNENSGLAQLSPRSLPTLVELCRKIRLTLGEDKAVLLKNPWDYPNFAYVKEAFPEARFVFIHRNPIRVIDSQIRAIRSVVEAKNEYVAMLSDRYKQFQECRPVRRFLTRLVYGSPHAWRLFLRKARRASNYFLDHVPSLPAADFASLRYEDLCRNPTDMIASILQFLGLDRPITMDLRQRISVRNVPLLPEVERHANRIVENLAPYCRRFDYTTKV
jgi:LPS sulfotransferase NodH